MKIIEQDSIGKAWQEAYNYIRTNGHEMRDDEQELLEVAHLNLIISNPEIIDDIVESSIGLMKDWMDNNFSEIQRVPELNDSWSYAWRLYNFNDVDQVNWVIEKLKKKPESKSATISMLNVAGSESYVPCVSLLDFKIREGVLTLTASCRSLDFGKKAIHNFTNLAKIAQKVADNLDLNKTRLIIQVTSGHIYKEDLTNE